MPYNSKDNKHLPPYMSFKTFLSFIGRLKSSTTPPVIDKSLLNNMSGSGRSQLMSALRFLRLIDSNASVQNGLRDLVEAYGTDTWTKVLYDTLREPYREIVEELDISAGTDAQLQKSFKDNANVEGNMQINSIRFYLAFMNEAGVPYSPHFGIRKVAHPQRKKVKKSVKSKKTSGKDGTQQSGDYNDSLEGIPPALSGLLKGLPSESVGWTKNKRDQFIKTFGVVLDFCYPVIAVDPPLEIEEFEDED